MELKSLLWAFLGLVCAEITLCQADKLREEIVRKHVSVKSPPRDESVISHFNPATHVYAAEGSVVIDRAIPKPKEPEEPQRPKDLSAKVSVHSPIASASESRHFDPAGHIYSATGELILNPESALLKPQNNFFKTSSKGLSSVNLLKQVSVKTPERQVSVISHFNPAGHTYEATGGVDISRVLNSFGSTRSREPQNAYVAPSVKVEKPKPTYKQPSTRFVHKSNPKPSDLSVHRSVSVKTPERKSSVINHFTPAGHRFDTTANVVITRTSPETGSSGIQYLEEPEEVKSKVRVAPKKPIAALLLIPTVKERKPDSGESIRKSPVQITRPKISQVSNDIYLEKSVSVHSPQRQSSVISHFTPAGHNYAATGNVVINRQTSKGSQLVRVAEQKPKIKQVSSISSTSSISPSYKTPVAITLQKTRPQIKVSKPKITYSGPSFSERESSDEIIAISHPKSISGGITLERHVSVKSPERHSNVISHFTPATHHYEATGDVIITRGPPSAGSIVQHIQPQQAKPTISSERRTSFKSTKYRKPEPTVVIRRRKLPQSNTLNVEKSVFVKSPERVSTVINHFTPAGHQYAASGGVSISRTSSQFPSQSLSEDSGSDEEGNPTIQRFEQTRYVAPKEEISKPTVTYKRPISASNSGKSVHASSFPASQQVSSGISLQKSVSVKTPQRQSSVISHFTPAGHNYEATGLVIINRASPSSQIGTVTIERGGESSEVRQRVSAGEKTTYVAPRVKVSKPVVQTITKARIPTPKVRVSKPEISYEKSISSTSGSSPFPVTKQVSTGLKLQKSVSVKSPERKSTVISHFTPAGHRYAATGNVVIDRGTISTVQTKPRVRVSSQGPRKTSVVAPQKYRPPVPVIVPAEEKSVPAFPFPKGLSDGDESGDDEEEEDDDSEEDVETRFDFGAAPKYDFLSQFSGIASYLPPVSDSGPKAAPPPPQPQFIPEPLPLPAPVQPQPAPPAPVQPYVPQVKQVQVQPYVPQVKQPAKSGGQFELRKRVSVKSPERKTNVIDHFNPAGHVYQATGDVQISRTL